MPDTVLIASPDNVNALKTRSDLTDAQTFSDADALGALDYITRQKPGVVALDRVFAMTSRGAALVNRIKADPSLNSCEIRIVARDGASKIARRKKEAPAAPAAAPAAPAPPLDHHGTRRAPRVRVVDGVDVLIDGKPATLVDLSTIGAQVISPTILKPNQRVRMSLPEAEGPIRFGAGVAWARFEMPKEGPRYRAGIEFFDADAATMTRFMDTRKRD